MSDTWGFETRQIHAGQVPDPATGAVATPIYQTTAYQFEDSEHAARLFALQQPGNIYTRIMNPTQLVFETRMASLEGGIAQTAAGVPGALAVSSGQAAETLAIINLAQAGDHVVSSPSLYGGTYNLFHYTLPKLGIEVSFIDDPDDLEAWAAAVRPNTKAFYAESIGNPRNDVLDIEAVAAGGRGERRIRSAGVPTGGGWSEKTIRPRVSRHWYWASAAPAKPASSRTKQANWRIIAGSTDRAVRRFFRIAGAVPDRRGPAARASRWAAEFPGASV